MREKWIGCGRPPQQIIERQPNPLSSPYEAKLTRSRSAPVYLAESSLCSRTAASRRRFGRLEKPGAQFFSVPRAAWSRQPGWRNDCACRELSASTWEEDRKSVV